MIYTLKQEELQARIESRGAQLISLTDSAGIEYIWQRENPYWQECAPVLFPVVGRCRDGICTIMGKEYFVGHIHGFALEMEFEAVEQTENSICFRLTDTLETCEKYPFPFVLEVKHTLSEGAIYSEFSVRNSGEAEMWFGLGGHPGINCPLTEQEKFDDYELDFGKPVTLDSLCVSEEKGILPQKKKRVVTETQVLSLNRTLFQSDALIFEEPPFHTVLLKSRKSGHGVRFDFENFSSFALWTEAPPAQAPFLCLEPWNGMGYRSGEGDELTKKAGIINLPVGEVFRCGYRIQPLS